MYGDLPCEIAYNVEYQESSSQEEEDGTEASYDEEEIKATKGCSQDDFWLKTPPFIASELLFFQLIVYVLAVHISTFLMLCFHLMIRNLWNDKQL